MMRLVIFSGAPFKGTIAAIRYLSGKTYESACSVRERMLKVNSESLLKCADAIEALCDGASFVIVGNSDACEKARDTLSRTVEYK